MKNLMQDLRTRSNSGSSVRRISDLYIYCAITAFFLSLSTKYLVFSFSEFFKCMFHLFAFPASPAMLYFLLGTCRTPRTTAMAVFQCMC
ncbi:hypothetical protein BDZ97DRAFT_1791494 [Flammula alnicola]|nr:hypothetical protein BDZ97DRAFT_1791494 [Flammula alnicola]